MTAKILQGTGINRSIWLRNIHAFRFEPVQFLLKIKQITALVISKKTSSRRTFLYKKLYGSHDTIETFTGPLK